MVSFWLVKFDEKKTVASCCHLQENAWTITPTTLGSHTMDFAVNRVH